MKFWVAFGASVVKRSTSMSPFSVAIVALVMAAPPRARSGLLDRDVVHLDRVRGLLGIGCRGDRIDCLHALRHMAEDRVGRVQASLGHVLQDDEELAAVRVRT